MQRDRRPGWLWRAATLAPGVFVLLGAGAPRGPYDSAPRRHLVEIRGMAFHPAVLKVARGDTITWVNRDIVPHTATSGGKPAWSTGNLAQEQSGQYVPQHTGTIAYFCELHPVMQGKLIIR